jgi:hypothetical protein
VKDTRQNDQGRSRIKIQTLFRQQIQTTGITLHPQMDDGRGLSAGVM